MELTINMKLNSHVIAMTMILVEVPTSNRDAVGAFKESPREHILIPVIQSVTIQFTVFMQGCNRTYH